MKLRQTFRHYRAYVISGAWYRTRFSLTKKFPVSGMSIVTRCSAAHVQLTKVLIIYLYLVLKTEKHDYQIDLVINCVAWFGKKNSLLKTRNVTISNTIFMFGFSQRKQNCLRLFSLYEYGSSPLKMCPPSLHQCAHPYDGPNWNFDIFKI